MLSFLQETDYLPYETESGYAGQFETARNLMGLFTLPVPTATSPDTLFAMGDFLNQGAITGIEAGLFSWNPISGAFLRRLSFPPFWTTTNISVVQSRMGQLYYRTASALQSFSLSNYPIGGDIIIPPALMGWPYFTDNFLYDDSLNYSMFVLNEWLVIHKGTNEVAQLYLPDTVVSCCLYTRGAALFLCQNNVLVGIDYTKGVVLFSTTLPSAQGNGQYTGSPQDVCMFWYAKYSQLLIMERVPDFPNGVTPTTVRYYTFLNTGIRLTKPILLDNARKGFKTRTLFWLNDELNGGVGGYQPQMEVTEQGILIGSPQGDRFGRYTGLVACTDLPEFAINCTVKVPDVIKPPSTQYTITYLTLQVDNKRYGDPPFQLNAQTNSPAPVRYDRISGNFAVSPSGLVTITGPGTCIVRASQPPFRNYSGPVIYDAAFNVQDTRTALDPFQNQFLYIPLTKGFLLIDFGIIPNGQPVQLPSGFDASRFIGWASPGQVYNPGDTIFHGINRSNFSGTAPTSTYKDGGTQSFGQSSNYGYIAWTEGAEVNVFNSGGGTYVNCATDGGTALSFFIGTLANGGTVPTTQGFNPQNALAIAALSGYVETGKQAHGVRACRMDQTGSADFQLSASYQDENFNLTGTGTANVLAIFMRPGPDARVDQVTGGRRMFIPTYKNSHMAIIQAAGVPNGGAVDNPGNGFNLMGSACAMAGMDAGQANHRCHGFYACTTNGGLTYTGQYADGDRNIWTGPGYVIAGFQR